MGDNEGPVKKRDTIEVSSWFLGSIILTIIIPALIIFLLPSDQRADGIATWAAVPVIEYLAISVGIGLGLDPLTSFMLTVLPCIGLCMLVMGLLSYFGERSERFTRFLDKVAGKIEKYPRLHRYGVIGSFFFVIITGVYIGSGISFLLGWHKVKSILIMGLGIVTVTTLIGLGTVGVIEVFFV
jgi:uncharacterized membrane protein